MENIIKDNSESFLSHKVLFKFIFLLFFFQIEIIVCDPVIKENLGKFVTYKIKGNDKDDSFFVIRRYSDFDKIRNALVIRWPGCYIPPLPPKQALVK